jgi:hypothetical protein
MLRIIPFLNAKSNPANSFAQLKKKMSAMFMLLSKLADLKQSGGRGGT